MSDEEKRRWIKPTTEKPGSGRSITERKVIARNARTESSKKWIERQLQDPYVRKAMDAGFRSRAAYKLLEIDEATQILKKGQRVIDLGCAPGGWIQVALHKGVGEVVGIDLLPVDPIDGARIFLGDVNEPRDVEKVLAALSGPPDLILSDMAANTTGHKQTDHLRTVALVELAVDFAIAHLAPGGSFCSKVFQGGTTKDLLTTLKTHFRTVKHIKPPASRAGSPEIYVVAKGFKGNRAHKGETE
ncbi:MAG: RlmE family RNA methyltransferase [Hyphomonas sp.]|uniref:RlmE family RNA methyltransferase n=1 Tax=Hyphomonas sp. TaxID=87 RepID=UPI00179B39DA|nr:RlmE family RNA methyltransferase [Hyphomonas sp.]MBA3069696.1 RlmE family RNA methyltransferase [Hyphomonas sp.]MBU3921373.1 RlmE family RNA methyltransferase [Alphaproteobacteria bacterium]MBU4062537.1 RlmE family RNA methyltransferase [Alphaproteobacteria bacterium]MBU4163888.1 RlmE family RNA methyltransferase [Alphaproteobacteria bacterium]